MQVFFMNRVPHIIMLREHFDDTTFFAFVCMVIAITQKEAIKTET